VSGLPFVPDLLPTCAGHPHRVWPLALHQTRVRRSVCQASGPLAQPRQRDLKVAIPPPLAHHSVIPSPLTNPIPIGAWNGARKSKIAEEKSPDLGFRAGRVNPSTWALRTLRRVRAAEGRGCARFFPARQGSRAGTVLETGNTEQATGSMSCHSPRVGSRVNGSMVMVPYSRYSAISVSACRCSATSLARRRAARRPSQPREPTSVPSSWVEVILQVPHQLRRRLVALGGLFGHGLQADRLQPGMQPRP
jgi:hypothetical protein